MAIFKWLLTYFGRFWYFKTFLPFWLFRHFLAIFENVHLVTLDKGIVKFFNITLSKPELYVRGWENGTGYKCRNMTSYLEVSFREYFDWYNSQKKPEISDHKHLNLEIIGCSLGMTLMGRVPLMLPISSKILPLYV